MSAIDEVLARNAEFARQFPGTGVGPTPALGLAVVTCIDVRVNVEKALGLDLGDAHVIRNAGGAITTDTIRSLVVSQFLLGTREIMLIKHTRCAMHALDEGALKDQVEAVTGVRPDFPLERAGSIKSDLLESAKRLRNSRLLRYTDRIRGFVYDVDTGVLTEVPLIPPVRSGPISVSPTTQPRPEATLPSRRDREDLTGR